MDAQHTLVRIYLFVCQRYRRRLRAAAQRQSNNSQPDFTDEEVLTVYLFGLIKKRRTITEIYDYIADHFSEWFPEMPSYQGYNRRLCRLSAVFAPLVEEARARSSPRSSRRPERGLRPARRGGPSAVFAPLAREALAEVDDEETRQEAVRIADSIPIMMAKQKRSSQASVASEFADKGYCSSKGVFFYGVKLHVVAERRPHAMPLPRRAGLTPGSENDLTALRQALPEIKGGQLYGDKAYSDGPMKERLAQEQDLDVFTPVKKKKGQEHLSAADKLLSKAVSRVRQPIESLFNWINEKTGIQCASKVRSYQGLLVHAFGRLAAAMLLLAFNS